MLLELNSRFVDSNVFVYVLMDDPANGARSVRILTRFEAGEETGWTSTLALSQVFSHLKKRKKPEAIDKFYEYLKESPIAITETSREDVEHAKEIKEEQTLDWSMWDDLVIASQMNRLKLTEIYSNDRDFDKFRNLKRMF
jgi:predicted nucleic acid-binding protein